MSGDFSSFTAKDTDDESGHGDEQNKNTLKTVIKNKKNINRKAFSRTPTDFSEAETSSSGFSDETSNKATQTDEPRPGSFLCTIADGEDCKFSIYDDASPIDSRFRNRPEYRLLFKEIFTVLKKAAENKDEGETLPLLDDVPVKVPPVTPATEDAAGDFTDDTQSVMSSVMSEQSIAISDRNVAPCKNGMIGGPDAKTTEKSTDKSAGKTEEMKGLTPYRRQPLEFLSVGVNVRKKPTSRRRSANRTHDRSESPVIASPSKAAYRNSIAGSAGKKRRDFRPVDSPSRTATSAEQWNGNSLQFYNRSIGSPTPSQNSSTSRRWGENLDFKPSTASQDLHKLKKLDLSYAEVLRNADKAKNKGARKK